MITPVSYTHLDVYKRQEQATVIENKQEETLIINKDDYSEIINTREEYKIKSQQSYLVSKNIQCAVHTHSIKTIRE